MASLRRLRIYAFVGLALVIPLGLGSKVYSGLGSTWVEGYAGDVLYELAWMFLVAGLWPVVFKSHRGISRLAISVFAITASLEFLQLWQPAWLQAWRATLAGKLILGTTFVAWDFFYYALGCLMGGAILKAWQTQLGLQPDGS